jgi:hypothetical protein
MFKYSRHLKKKQMQNISAGPNSPHKNGFMNFPCYRGVAGEYGGSKTDRAITYLNKTKKRAQHIQYCVNYGYYASIIAILYI